MGTKRYQRYPAQKMAIRWIRQATLVNEEETQFLQHGDQKIHRVNIIATIVQEEILGSITNLLIDDGEETIILRKFEETPTISAGKTGEVVLIIGKVRVFNKEKYISPEIIKPIDAYWLKVRQQELNKIHPVDKQNGSDVVEKKQEIETEEVMETENIREDSSLPIEKICQLIKELDQGEGVAIEEVLEKSTVNNTEEFIQKMLEQGDIFQNIPGKIKVL